MMVLIIFQVILFHQGKICFAHDHLTIFLFTDYCYIFCDLHPIKCGNGSQHYLVILRHQLCTLSFNPIQIPQGKRWSHKTGPPHIQMPVIRSACHLCFLPDVYRFQIPVIPSLDLIISQCDTQNLENKQTNISLIRLPACYEITQKQPH